jgi:hypothetical protein
MSQLNTVPHSKTTKSDVYSVTAKENCIDKIEYVQPPQWEFKKVQVIIPAELVDSGF